MKNKNFGRKRQAIYILSNRKSTRIIKTLMDFFFFIKVKIKMVCFSVPSYYQRGGISMTEDEAYKVHIQYTFNAFCKVVIRHAAIDIILKLRRRWEREVSLDYLMNEKFVQLAEPEQLEEYLFTACGQTAVLYHAELAAALALLPEQTQEEIFRYYFLRQPQRVIGVHIGRTRSTAGRHIQLALKRLRRLMEGKRYE